MRRSLCARLLLAPLGLLANTLPRKVQPRPSSSLFGYVPLPFEIRDCRKFHEDQCRNDFQVRYKAQATNAPQQTIQNMEGVN